jgi:hypothetical protein
MNQFPLTKYLAGMTLQISFGSARVLRADIVPTNPLPLHPGFPMTSHGKSR